jgi:hypothetical protein
VQIHLCEEIEGDILLFLTGQEVCVEDLWNMWYFQVRTWPNLVALFRKSRTRVSESAVRLQTSVQMSVILSAYHSIQHFPRISSSEFFNQHLQKSPMEQSV